MKGAEHRISVPPPGTQTMFRQAFKADQAKTLERCALTPTEREGLMRSTCTVSVTADTLQLASRHVSRSKRSAAD